MQFCDYIANMIREAALTNDMLTKIGPVGYDLDKYGAMKSTAKTIEVTDRNGQTYKITVEAV